MRVGLGVGVVVRVGLGCVEFVCFFLYVDIYEYKAFLVRCVLLATFLMYLFLLLLMRPRLAFYTWLAS